MYETSTLNRHAKSHCHLYISYYFYAYRPLLPFSGNVQIKIHYFAHNTTTRILISFFHIAFCDAHLFKQEQTALSVVSFTFCLFYLLFLDCFRFSPDNKLPALVCTKKIPADRARVLNLNELRAYVAGFFWNMVRTVCFFGFPPVPLCILI